MKGLATFIMVQGTSSHVGKSVLVTALCRIFQQEGWRVAPFKSQNMALNSGVTASGGEMGRAQIAQAEAARVEPRVEMNPILLKPTGQASSQVILLGRPLGNMSAREYHLEFHVKALEVIRNCLETLDREYQVVVIEGAGSPAEVNLKERDIVNMRVAALAGAPVLLVADIDRGGALAAVVGTLELLEEEERKRVAGIILNKFRGDRSLLQPALDFLEEKTGKPVLGVLPYLPDLDVPAEDSVSLEDRQGETGSGGCLEVAVPRLPYISNFTDLDPLAAEGIKVRYIRRAEELGSPDLVVLPGSKNTLADLTFLEETGLKEGVRHLAARGTPILGICGGYQMLGLEISDPYHTESDLGKKNGLGLLKVRTVLGPEKITHQAVAVAIGPGEILGGCPGVRLSGYEIHTGKTVRLRGARPAFRLLSRSGQRVRAEDGAASDDGLIIGTYLHGLLENVPLRRSLLGTLCQRRGLPADLPASPGEGKEAYDRLAETVRKNLDMEKIYGLLGLAGRLPHP